MNTREKNRKQWRAAVLWTVFLLSLCCLTPSVNMLWGELGLSTRFSDVILENLGINGSYNLTSIKNLPLTLINTSSEEKEILVEVEAPTKEELKPGYEAIPDPTWVRIIPDRFRLTSGARNLSDIIINIPNDPSLIGKSYQVMFWAHTVEQTFLGVAVRVRVRFSIQTTSPERAKMQQQQNKLLDLNFRLDPISVSAVDVPLGKTLDLKKDKNVNVKLVNTGEQQLKLKIESAEYQHPMKPPQGYEAIPDLKWLEVVPALLVAKPDTITPLKIKLKIPNKPEYKDKRYAGLIWVSLVGETIPLNVYSQVLITTEK